MSSEPLISTAPRIVSIHGQLNSIFDTPSSSLFVFKKNSQHKHQAHQMNYLRKGVVFIQGYGLRNTIARIFQFLNLNDSFLRKLIFP